MRWRPWEGQSEEETPGGLFYPSSGLTASTLHPGFCVTVVGVMAPLGTGYIVAGPLPATSMGGILVPSPILVTQLTLQTHGKLTWGSEILSFFE